jgi:flagellar M-ring protein FliF
MDSSGRLLSTEYADTSGLAGATTAAYELTSRVERDLEDRLIAMLTPALGPGNVVCQVRANLNLDQTRTTEDAYVTDPENPQGVLRSTQQIIETYSGTGTPAGGTAGGLDVPTYASGETGESSYQRTETTQNYEVTRVTTETLVNPGTIKNLSVAVMVNKDLDDEETQAITDTVSAALGLDPMRQDKISITSWAFDTTLVDGLLATDATAEAPMDRIYIYAIAVAAALAVGTVILLVMRRRKKAAQVVEAPMESPLLSEEDESGKLSPEIKSKQRLKENVERMARTNPEAVASLIKTWLLEDEK